MKVKFFSECCGRAMFSIKHKKIVSISGYFRQSNFLTATNNHFSDLSLLNVYGVTPRNVATILFESLDRIFG
jgi:hypothetical protein